MKNRSSIIIAILMVLSGILSAQPAGTLDPTFNGTGKVVYDKDNMDLYQDVRVQDDGKIVAVGTSYTPTWSSEIEVTRYLADGSFDLTFGTGGHFNYSAGIETGAYKCIIRDDGKMIISGYTTDYATYSMLVLQINADGTLDPAFGNGGVTLAETGPTEKNVYAMALQDDGKILLAGYSVNSDSRNAPVVLRFTETGLLDMSFGTNGVATVPVTEIDNDFSAVSVQSDGKIVAAGHISNGMSWFSLLVARFNENGQLDSGYGANGIVNLNLGNVDDEFYDMVLTADDEAILTGFSVSQGDLYYHLLLMKLDTAGGVDSSFGVNGYTIVGTVPYTFGDAMVMQTDGRILVAGSTGELTPSNNDWGLWRFTPDGNLDPDFGANGMVTTEFFGNPDEALGVALYQDKIVLAGKTRNASNKLDFAVTRYTNDIGVSISEHAGIPDVTVWPNPLHPGQSVNLLVNMPETGNIRIELLSPAGTILALKTVEAHQGNRPTFMFDLPDNISRGIYCLRISEQRSPAVIKKIMVD